MAFLEFLGLLLAVGVGRSSGLAFGYSEMVKRNPASYTRTYRTVVRVWVELGAVTSGAFFAMGFWMDEKAISIAVLFGVASAFGLQKRLSFLQKFL